MCSGLWLISTKNHDKENNLICLDFASTKDDAFLKLKVLLRSRSRQKEHDSKDSQRIEHIFEKNGVKEYLIKHIVTKNQNIVSYFWSSSSSNHSEEKTLINEYFISELPKHNFKKNLLYSVDEIIEIFTSYPSSFFADKNETDSCNLIEVKQSIDENTKDHNGVLHFDTVMNHEKGLKIFKSLQSMSEEELNSLLDKLAYDSNSTNLLDSLDSFDSTTSLPKHPDLLNLFGCIFEVLENHVEKMKYYKLAAQMGSNLGILNLAKYFKSMKEWNTSLNLFNKIVKVFPDIATEEIEYLNDKMKKECKNSASASASAEFWRKKVAEFKI